MKTKLSFILIIFFLSCQKEKSIVSLEGQTVGFNISDAKNYYTDELIVLKAQSNERKSTLNINYKIDWETYKSYFINDSTELMTVRLASFSKSILGNYGKSFIAFKKVKKKITGHIINVQPNVNGFDYYGVFDLNGDFIKGVKTKDEKFVATFSYVIDEQNQKVMSGDEIKIVNSCQRSLVDVVLNGIHYSHYEYYNCTVDNENYYFEMPGSGGGGSSFGNASSYADYLNSMNQNFYFVSPTLPLKMYQTDMIKYPLLTDVVSSLDSYVANNPKLLEAISKFSFLSKEDVLANLKFGEGALIIMRDDYPDGLYGTHFDGTIYLNANYVNSLESSLTNLDKYNAIRMFMIINILHEFVHWGNFDSMRKYPGEAGDQFECATFGGTVNYDLNTGILKIVPCI